MFHLKEDSPIPEEFTPHTHPQRAELLYFISGKCNYKIEEASFSLRPGDLILVSPNEIHQLVVSPDIPYERICINFRPEALTELDVSDTLNQLLNDRTIGRKKIFHTADFNDTSYANHFFDMMEPSPNRHLTILANMILILQKLNAIYERFSRSDHTVSNLEQELVYYINQHLEQELTLEALCKHFYLSRAQLCRFFKDSLGTSIGKYINAKRMVLAQKLILQGQRPTDVCHKCGYQNYSTFFRAYCSFFGHSPKEDSVKGITGLPFSIPIRRN